MLVLRLDEAGIVCSSASACASGSGESDVVRKLYEKTLTPLEVDLHAKTTLRFSLGRDTKTVDIKNLLKKLSLICK